LPAQNATISLYSDAVAPIVSGMPTLSANSAGWYSNDVTVTWTVTDPAPSSGTPTTPAPTVASLEGTNIYTSGSSCDPAGNCGTGSIQLKIDKTKPVITYSVSPTSNLAGWNNSNVTVTFSCADALSGVANCSSPVTVSMETAGQTVTGTAMDRAGNSQTATAVVKLDKTAPTVSNMTMSGIVTLPLFGSILLGSTTNLSANVADNLSGVAAAEYYFDTDPGQGNGTAMTLSANPTTNGTATASNVNVASLHGQHTLHVRVKDAAGNWSIVANAAFRRL
jgi:hypothetical protein